MRIPKDGNVGFIVVGKKWNYTKIPNHECMQLEMHEGTGPMLLLLYDSPTKAEIDDVLSGEVKMGYYVRESVLFVVCKIGSMLWADAPFSIRRYDKYGMDFSWMREMDPQDKNTGLGIGIYLIDVKTKILHAMRLIGASNRFTMGFIGELIKQQDQKYSDQDYNRIIDEVYETSTPVDLAKKAQNIFTIPMT